MRASKNSLFHISTFILILPLFLAACATTPQPLKMTEAVFYPPSPELPRLQFLRSFTGALDIESKTSAFESFVTGVKENQDRPSKPYGVAMYDDKIYVCDTNASVMVFDLKAKTYSRLKGAQGLGKLLQPINISIDENGNKYIADPVRGQVVAFDKNDSYLKAYGMGNKWKPVDAEARDGRLYVADSQNARIRVFDLDKGTIVAEIGRNGKPEENLVIPTNLTFDKEGTLFVTDSGRFQIVMYDRDGHFLGKIGNPGKNPGYFARPRGVVTDKSGRVYAVDAAFDNVQIFNEKGQLLLFFGGPGKKPGNLFLPAGIFIDYDHIDSFKEYIDPRFDAEYLVFVVSQFGDRLINVYAHGKEREQDYPEEDDLRQNAIKRLEEWIEKNPPAENEQQQAKANP